MSTQLFLVVGRSRTGSNCLMRMLRQHPSIECEGEIFARVSPGEWQASLEELRSRSSPWCGFKMFYYHGHGDRHALWDHLSRKTDLPVIHMKRRNQLRAEVSRRIAMHTGLWTMPANKRRHVPDKRIELDPEKLVKMFNRMIAAERQTALLFADHPVLEIEYEELAVSPLAAYRSAAELLGVEPYPAKPVTQRQNPEPLSELISNFGELRTYFSGTEWECFFQDE